MRCFNCNSELAEGTNFCPHCGAQQPAAPQYQQQNPQSYPQPVPQGYPQNYPNPAMRPQQPRRNNTMTVAIIAIAVVLIAAIIAGVYVYTNKKSTSETEPESTEQVSQSGLDERQYDWLSERLVTAADLSGKSAGDLRLMRNAMYAKHGYKFKSKDLQEYFSNFSWYTPQYANVDNMLSQTEQANVSFIQKFEGGNNGAGAGTSAATPSRISSVGFTGDFSDVACHTWLTDADVRGLSKSQLRILRNTIFARHGRKFVSADLRNYFNQFSWYNPRYDEIPMNYLSETEQHNINLIKRYE